MNLPKTTRLRYVIASNEEQLSKFCDALGKRIEIKSIVPRGKKLVMFFIPDDKRADVRSVDLTKKKGKTK